jgi:hypothetical protein
MNWKSIGSIRNIILCMNPATYYPFCTLTGILWYNNRRKWGTYDRTTSLAFVQKKRNFVKANIAYWIGHILLRNCILQRVIEGKIKGRIEVTRRQGRRRRKLLDGLKERRGYSHLKEEALHSTMWRARFGRGFVPVVRQTAK